MKLTQRVTSTTVKVKFNIELFFMLMADSIEISMESRRFDRNEFALILVQLINLRASLFMS